MGEALRKPAPPVAWRAPVHRARPLAFADVIQPRPLTRQRLIHLRWVARELLAAVAIGAVLLSVCGVAWSLSA